MAAKTAPKRPTSVPPIFACVLTDAALEVMEGEACECVAVSVNPAYKVRLARRALRIANGYIPWLLLGVLALLLVPGILEGVEC